MATSPWGHPRPLRPRGRAIFGKRRPLLLEGPMKSEEDEIQELEQLFNSGSNFRESNLPVALYAKLEVFEENRRKAENARKEREKRALIIQSHNEERYEKSRALRERAREKHGVAIEEHKASNLASGIATRDLEARWQVEREEEKKAFIEKAREMVLGGKNQMKEMQKAEDEMAAIRRSEGLAQRKAMEEAVREKAQQLTETKSGVVATIKEQERQGVLKVEQFIKDNKVAKAANTRQATKQWKAEKQRAEEEYLADAAAKRAAALAGRQAARRKAEEMKAANTKEARMERENDNLVHEEKVRHPCPPPPPLLGLARVFVATGSRTRIAPYQSGPTSPLPLCRAGKAMPRRVVPLRWWRPTD